MEKAQEIEFPNIIKFNQRSMAIISGNGDIKFVNGEFSKLLQINLEEMKSLTINDLIYKEIDIDNFFNFLEGKSNSNILILKMKTLSNKIITVRLQFDQIKNIENENYFIIIIQETNQLMKIEELTSLDYRMELLGKFANGITLDFNNLLMAIGGNLSLVLMDSSKLDDKHVEYLKNSQRVVYQASGLVKQLQQLSSKQKGEISNVDLYEVANDSFSLLKKVSTPLIEKRIEFDRKKFFIHVNKIKLNQVFLNLATNSIHAIEAKEKMENEYISISASIPSENELHDNHITPGEYVKIEFQDSGIGMDEVIKQQIFYPFFTTKDESKFGKGLSLSVIYFIITRHMNGNIFVDSTPGEGTTFQIYLPLSTKLDELPKESKTDTTKYSVFIPDSPKTILVVDDEITVLQLLEDVLELYGHNVITASNGLEAVEIFKKHQNNIDVIVLDLTMPKMGGEEAFQKFKDLNPDIKIIISSGHTEEEVRKGILSNADGFLLKPYHLSNLGNVINNLFGETRKE